MEDIKTGTKVDHDRYGEGVITESHLSGFTVVFDRAGKMEFSRMNDDFEILEEGNVDDVFNNPIDPYTIDLLKSSPSIEKLLSN